VRESQLVNSIIEEGRREGILIAGRSDLLAVVRILLADPVPEVIRLAVEETSDPDLLTRWHRAALRAKTLAEFVNAMNQAR
jgi:hypothetical protein